MQGVNHAAHIIRTALSEGQLKVGTVESTQNGLVAKEINKASHGLVILSTFASGKMDYELKSH